MGPERQSRPPVTESAGAPGRAEAATASAADGGPLEQAARLDPDEVLRLLETAPGGLTSSEAARRLARYGPNEVRAEERTVAAIVRAQVTDGINVSMALAGLLALAVGAPTDAAIILVLVALNVTLSIVQEYRAERALAALRALLPLKARVWRDGRQEALAAASLVPGDVVEVRTGDLVPADVRLLQGDALEANQAILTGESLTQEKDAAAIPGGPPAQWSNVLFAGTTVVTGWGRGVVVATAEATQFGQTASLMHGIRTPSNFQANVGRFGGFLLRFGLLLALAVFAANAALGRGWLVSLTLAIALMLGMVPEALPAVTATTFALGAAALARKQVLVRRLAAVEDMSVVDTLCIDKTGTITENRTVVGDLWSRASAGELLESAVLCSAYPLREANIVDEALVQAAQAQGLNLERLAALPRRTVVPFSSDRKRMSVAVEREGRHLLICKGAAAVVLERCARLRTGRGDADLALELEAVRESIAAMQRQGARVIAVGVRELPEGAPAGGEPDTDLSLLGVIGLRDTPRPGAAAALARAAELGVEVKILTGDALPRARALAEQIGLQVDEASVVGGEALQAAGAAALAERGRIFAEVVPADKHRLVRALQAAGHQVAVTGDGVNDVPALNAANVGIALASGSEAAKGASDLVLLQDDLGVIVDGLREGRRIFTNINRYLLYTMVSNFANVFIVAVASLLYDFLPLLPEQVLVLNVLADLPMLAVVTDRVGLQDLATPRRWDVRRLVELTLYLGILNALFAFSLLRFLRRQPPDVVHAAWFLLLGTTALLILFVVRTTGWFWQAEPPSLAVSLSLAAGMAVTLGIVNLPFTREVFRLAPLPAAMQAAIVGYSSVYLLVADLLKRAFLRSHGVLPPRPDRRRRRAPTSAPRRPRRRAGP